MSELRVAVIGAGILGQRHARVFHEMERTRLVGVADHSVDKARAAAARADAPAFTDADTLLAQVECDAVAVATPDHLHRDPVMAALRAGKHVLVEKPLATTRADGNAMIEEAQRRQLVLQVNFSQRYVSEYAWMKQQIDSGLIGRPVQVLTSKQDTIMVPTRMISWAAATSPIFFMSSHDIDLVTWFLNARCIAVQAHEQRGVLDAAGVATHDSVDALLTLDTGATVNLHSSWVLPESYPTVTVDRLSVIGEAGMLHFESRGRSVECYSVRGGQTVTFTGPQTANEVDGRIRGAFRTSLEAFVDTILTKKEPATSARLTVHVLETQVAILEAVQRSGPAGQQQP